MNRICHYTPNGKLVVLIDAYGLKIRIMRYQPSAFTALIPLELFERIFAVDIGYNEIAVLGFETPIYHHDIPVQNTRITHGITFHMRIKRRFRMRRHLPRQVNTFSRMIGSRRRKTGMKRFRKLQGQLSLFRICYVYQFTHS